MKNKIKVGLIASMGGHLTELLIIQKHFKFENVFYVSEKSPVIESLSPCYTHLPLIVHPINIIKYLIKSIQIVFKEKPELLISTGAETIIPIAYLSKLFFKTKIIYIECSAQVHKKSLTGIILYPIADLFLVQWKSLLKEYGSHAKYQGSII